MARGWGCGRWVLQALDMVRIEAGLIFAGYDFSDQTDPFEAGIGFTVPLKSKTDDFIGREALIRRKEHPSPQVRRAGDRCGNVDVGHGDCLHVGRAQVGEVTSVGPLADPWQEHRACAGRSWRMPRSGRRWKWASWTASRSGLPAVIVPLSHYDPKKTRPQG